MAKNRTWTDNDLKQACKKAYTYADTCRKLGLVIAGGNLATVKKYIKALNIDVSHFDPYRECHGGIPGTPLEDVMVENSSYSRTALRRRIIKNRILAYKCAICGQLPEWNGKPLIMILDHINGIGNDHRISNLRFVCPNCNTQLKTFAGRNTHRVRTRKMNHKCVDCGADIWPVSTRCRSCALIFHSRKKIDWPPLDKLTEMVTETSYLALSRKLGVSDVAIKKHIVARTKQQQREKENL